MTATQAKSHGKNSQSSATPEPAQQSVSVQIYDQTYNLRGVDPDYVRGLAATVDAKMRAVAERSSTVDSLRVAVLAALNLADELAVTRERAEARNGAGRVARKASELNDLLDSVLAG
jgi:cell division protein ZapA